MSKFEKDADIIPVPCPGLMEFVEQGKLEGPEINEFLGNILTESIRKNAAAVVLGCTHYPFIRETITGDKNDDLGLIMNSQFHNTNTILMGETSDASSAHGVNNEILLQTIVNYTKSKMNFRKSKQDVLKRLLVKLVEIGKKQSKFFKGYAVLSDFERQTDENGTQMFGNANEGYNYSYFMKHVNETIIDFDSYVFKSLQN